MDICILFTLKGFCLVSGKFLHCAPQWRPSPVSIDPEAPPPHMHDGLVILGDVMGEFMADQRPSSSAELLNHSATWLLFTQPASAPHIRLHKLKSKSNTVTLPPWCRNTELLHCVSCCLSVQPHYYWCTTNMQHQTGAFPLVPTEHHRRDDSFPSLVW